MTTKLSDMKFTDRDEFQRKIIAEKIINLLASKIDISPMMIDGGWGTGKTEFCHKLINLFTSLYSEYQIIYIDSYKEDHTDNPLMTIISAILSSTKQKKFKTKISKAVLPLLRLTFKTAATGAVNHILRQNSENIAEEYKEIIKESSNELINHTLTNLLHDHQNANKNIESLQTILNEMAKDYPLVIFIDELDRCKPDFAIGILEKIKHIFDVPNVKFVLLANRDQLKASIEQEYGAKIDAERYLDKFIKYNFNLPELDCKDLSSASYKHFINLLSQSDELKSSNIIQEFEGVLVQKIPKNLIVGNNLSLREVETYIRYLSIYSHLTTNLTRRTLLEIHIDLVAIFIFCFIPDLKLQITKDTVDAHEIARVLNYNKPGSLFESGENITEFDLFSLMLIQNSKINHEKYKVNAKSALVNDEIHRVNKLNSHLESIKDRYSITLNVKNPYDFMKKTFQSLQLF